MPKDQMSETQSIYSVPSTNPKPNIPQYVKYVYLAHFDSSSNLGTIMKQPKYHYV